MDARLLLAPLVLAVLTSACLDSPPSAAADRSIGPSGKTVEVDVYVGGPVSWSPVEGTRVGFFGFSLDPEGPFTVPGPELRFRQGDHVRVLLHGGDHTIHWHGLDVPWGMDGVPFMTQGLGAGEDTFLYEFDATQSGTYWYHCHVDAPTHIDFGLFGALIIEPRNAAADPPFDREATMMLHEIDSTHVFNNPAVGRAFGDEQQDPLDPAAPASLTDAPEYAKHTAHGAIDLAGLLLAEEGVTTPLSEGPRDYYPAPSLRYQPYYDTFMINGKSFPETEPLHIGEGETLRIRLINAGQLVHTMHLHGHHFLVTHKDGYLLTSPYWADTLMIGPAERYDLYVEGTNPGIWDLHDHGGAWELGAYAANQHAFPGGMNTALVYDDFQHGGLPMPHPSSDSGAYMLYARQGSRHT